MDDANSLKKVSMSRTITSVVREFAGSRIERELVVQAFAVVWDVCESTPSRLDTGDDSTLNALSGAVSVAPTSRFAEGVAA